MRIHVADCVLVVVSMRECMYVCTCVRNGVRSRRSYRESPSHTGDHVHHGGVNFQEFQIIEIGPNVGGDVRPRNEFILR